MWDVVAGMRLDLGAGSDLLPTVRLTCEGLASFGRFALGSPSTTGS